MSLPPAAVFWGATGLWAIFIFFMGTSRFGRSGTQSWIDRLESHASIHAFLHRHHGKFRAAFHYVEFTTLTVLLYWALGRERWEWSPGRALLAYSVSCACAYLDELHQSRTPGRMFRKIDFLHSLFAATLAVVGIYCAILFFPEEG